VRRAQQSLKTVKVAVGVGARDGQTDDDDDIE
jgi:hypothetical protein